MKQIASKQVEISLVIPTYKAETFIKPSFRQLISFMKKQKKNYEIIYVVDGSPDNSSGILEQVAEEYPSVHVYAYRKNKGKGYAVRYGLKKAKGTYVGFIDAGSDIDLKSLGNIMKTIEHDSQYDVWIADKLHKDSIVHAAFIRQIYSVGFRYFTKMLLWKDLHDTQTGLKLMRRSVFNHISRSLKVRGFAFDVEMMLQIAQAGYAVARCPVHLIAQKGEKSTVRVGHIIKMATDVSIIAYNHHIKTIQRNVSLFWHKIHASLLDNAHLVSALSLFAVIFSVIVSHLSSRN